MTRPAGRCAVGVTRPCPSRQASAPRGRALASAVSIGVLVVLSVLGLAGPAVADDELASSYPAASATAPGTPAEISLTFTGEVRNVDDATKIEVFTQDGRMVAEGPPEIVGATVTQNLSGEPAVGELTVRWSVVSSDGHPVSDEYTFTVQESDVTSTTASPTPSPTPSSAPESGETEGPTAASGYGDIHSREGDTGLDALPLMVITGGVGLLSAAAVVVILAGRQRRRDAE